MPTLKAIVPWYSLASLGPTWVGKQVSPSAREKQEGRAGLRDFPS